MTHHDGGSTGGRRDGSAGPPEAPGNPSAPATPTLMVIQSPGRGLGYIRSERISRREAGRTTLPAFEELNEICSWTTDVGYHTHAASSFKDATPSESGRWIG